MMEQVIAWRSLAGDESTMLCMQLQVCVFKITGRDIPIVHRIMKVHDSPNGRQVLSTQCNRTLALT
jgi:hypothetical protein